MKKILNSCLLLLLLAGLSSCGETEPVWVEPAKTMSVEQADLVFEPAGGTATFIVKAENAFTVEADRTWCTVAADGSEVAVTVTANPYNETRYARVNMISGEEKLGITVQQAGIIVKGFSPKDTTLNGAAQSIVFSYTTNAGDISFASTDAWLTVSQSEGTVTIAVEANENGVRAGSVSYALGEFKGSFEVLQYPVFSVNAAWTPAYGGKCLRQEAVVNECFAVNVDDGSADSYAMLVVSQASFTEKALSMDDYMAKFGWQEAVKKLEAAVAAEPGTTLADFLSTGSVADTLVATDYPAGKWYVMAVGLTGEGQPTGKYAATLVSNEAASYASWIGSWAATDDRGNEFTLTFAQNVSGESYTVTGFKGHDFPCNATYNADGTVVVTGSSTKSLITDSYVSGDYTYSTMFLLGAYQRSNTTTINTGASLKIGFGAQADATHASIGHHWVKVSNDWCPYVQFVFRGSAKKGTGAASTRVLERIYLPLTLTKL